MKEELTIQQQADALTPEQKQTLLKVHKYGTLLLLALTIPGIILMCLGMFAMSSDAYAENTYKVFQTIGAVLMALSIGVLLFIKIKFPYYSDKLATHIRYTERN